MNRINIKYQEAIKQNREKRKKIGRTIFMFSLLLLFIAFVIDLLISVVATLIILLIFAGISIICLILMLVLPIFLSEKPLFEVLVDEIIKDINLNEQRNIDYLSYPKEKELFNRSGLYPKGTSKLNRFQMMMSTDYHTNVNLFFTEIFTQTDKSKIVYLKGLYIKFDTMNQNIFQIRKKGKERHKDIKLNKEVREDKTIIYTDGQPIKENYLSLYDKLDERYKQVDISGIKRQVHIAIHDFFNFKREKKITQDIYNEYYKMIKETIDLVDEISKDISN
ncbi:MAG: hypothetical protein ACLFPM_04730 [Candidatus Izemoplasmatales bacterium]